MGNWLLILPVVWMAVIVFSGTYLVSWLIQSIVMRLAVGERAKALKEAFPRHAAAARHHIRSAGRLHRRSGVERLGEGKGRRCERGERPSNFLSAFRKSSGRAAGTASLPGDRAHQHRGQSGVTSHGATARHT